MSEEKEFKSVLTEQFTESIRVVGELTQSLHNLQGEVEDHSDHILQAKSELLVLKDKLATLTRLVQGEGLTDSLTTAVVELQTKLRVLEQWQRDFREDKREGKSTNTTVIVLVVSCVASIMGAVIAVIIPILLKG